MILHKDLNDANLLASIIRMTADLVESPSQAGVNDSAPVHSALLKWFDLLHLNVHSLYDETGKVVALIVGSSNDWMKSKRILCLNACADTAPTGLTEYWKHPPLRLSQDEEWFYGRGSADSKIAVALFSHLISRFEEKSKSKSVVAVFDLDEHTGLFKGMTRYLDLYSNHTDGIYIGYPGFDEIKCGARGLIRLKVTFNGIAHHSGSTRIKSNPITTMTDFLIKLRSVYVCPATKNFDLPSRVTVTSVRAGDSYGITPSQAEALIDIRTVPDTNSESLKKEIWSIANECATDGSKVSIEYVAEWPAYSLAENHWLSKNLLLAAKENTNQKISAALSGPTNIGNLAAKYHVPATCGFGIRHRNIHGIDECFDGETILPVYATYLAAVLSWHDS